MDPITIFELAWQRCDELSGLQTYLSKNVSAVVKTEELLRAEWMSRVSALDLFVHELVAQSMLQIFQGTRPHSAGYNRFEVSGETLARILNAQNRSEALAAYELNVRSKLKFMTFQDPEKIADGVRLISDIELWNCIAKELGATDATKQQQAKLLKGTLVSIIDRRNKISHEGDMQPSHPRIPWPIKVNDLTEISKTILQIVNAINKLVW